MQDIIFKDFIQLQRGFDLPKSRREDGEVPVIGATRQQGLHNVAKVNAPGVTTGRSGALGQVLFIKTPFWPLNTCLWVKDFKDNDPRYVYYCLKTLNLEHFNSGAGVPTLNRNHLDILPLNIHSHEEQKGIAQRLGTYDDLIENNLKRIAVLERIAWSIYDYYFGGEQNIQGVVTIDSAFSILGGGTPSKKEPRYWDDGTINWFTPSDLTSTKSVFIERSSIKINALGLKKSAAKLFPAKSIMLTSRATIGVVAINTSIAATNQGFITCIPNKQTGLYYLYLWLKNNTEQFEQKASGATFKEINKSVFKTLDFPLPLARVLKEFEKTVTPLFEHLLNLQRANQKLAEAQELLLSRLISGEIRP